MLLILGTSWLLPWFSKVSFTCSCGISSIPGNIVSSTPGSILAILGCSSSGPIGKIGAIIFSSCSIVSGKGFFLGLPLPLLGCLFICSSVGKGFFLGLPLPLFIGSICGSSCILSLKLFCVSSNISSGIIWGSSKKSCLVWPCFSAISFRVLIDFGFTLANFLFPFILTDDGITTGLDIIVSFVFDTNNLSLGPSSTFLSWFLNISETLLLNDIICWYLGDLSSNTALTFSGKNLLIILSWVSLYCAAILLKLSIYLSSFFPSLW